MTRAKFIKTYARSIDDEPKLTLERIESNTRKGIETLIVPDCNFLIDLEELADIKPNFGILRNKPYQISEAIEILLIACSKRLWLNWCPGFALDEMPSLKAQHCSQKLEVFYKNWELFSTNYSTDSSTNSSAIKHGKTFDSWGYNKQLFMAPSYISLILISILNIKLVKLSPQDKTNIYINYIEKNINLFSAKEFLIALICFTRNTLKLTELSIIKELTIKNFISNQYHSDKIKAKCANGARDLSYINSCNFIENKYPNKDIWFLTKDYKLLTMLKNASNMAGVGGTGELIKIQGVLYEDPFIQKNISFMQEKTFKRHKLGKLKNFNAESINLEKIITTIWHFHENPYKLLQYNYPPNNQ